MDKKTRLAKSVQDLEVYKLAFDTAMQVFEASRAFPVEERYSLTGQIRRSTRSVYTNLAEGWRKRRYVAVFTNKLFDAAQEAAQTQIWLKFAERRGYLSADVRNELNERYKHIFAMLNTMEGKAEMFCEGYEHRPTSRLPRATGDQGEK
ncbi:MAG: four helix bundle protein [Syntrophus sp. (in: bacteria)]|nr:four helix bundle protein [Syntrophus sp. (in: bacteria)]